MDGAGPRGRISNTLNMLNKSINNNGGKHADRWNLRP
jgi:hypothetical protein